jgi:hypothetical protein
VKLTLLHLTHGGRPLAVAVSTDLDRFAPPEEVTRAVLEELAAEDGARGAHLDALKSDVATVKLGGLGEVFLALDRSFGFPVMGVLSTSAEVEAWGAGRRSVVRTRAVDAAWLWRGAKKGGGR